MTVATPAVSKIAAATNRWTPRTRIDTDAHVLAHSPGDPNALWLPIVVKHGTNAEWFA